MCRRASESARARSAVSAKSQTPTFRTAEISSYVWPRRSSRLRIRSAKKRPSSSSVCSSSGPASFSGSRDSALRAIGRQSVRQLREIAIATAPRAARRRPYGSFDPVGTSPIRKSPQSESNRSASERIAPDGFARRIVRSGGRTVLVVDRLPHRVRVPLAAGVDAAHDPLQVRELLDDERVQVRLREQGRRAHRLDEVRAAGQARDLLGQILDPRRLLAVVAELVLEGQARKLRQPPLEPLLHVRLEEEARVRQPRVQHPLAALRDEALAVLGVVHDRDEVRQQALRTAHRDVLLVRAHGRDGDLLGQLQELRRERAAHEARPLDEVGERVREVRVRLDLARRLRSASRRAVSRIADPAGLGVGLDEARCGASRGSRPARSRGSRPRRGRDGRGSGPTRPRRRARAERRRPPKSATTPRTGRTNARSPAPQRIIFGNVSPATTRGTTSASTSSAGRPGIDLRAATVLPRGESTTTRSATLTFCAFANPSPAFVGLPSASKARRGRRAEHLGGAVLLALGDPAQHGREAPRRRVRLRGRGREAFLRERVGQAPGELRARRQQRRRRDLLRSDFQKKVLDVHSQVLRDRLEARLLKRPRAPAPRAGNAAPACPPPRRARRRRRDRGSAGRSRRGRSPKRRRARREC